MATTSKRTIYLLGQPIYNEDGAAAEAIVPGMLTRGVTTINKNNVADASCIVTVALERSEMGKSIDDAYAIGDTVKIGSFHAGSHFLGLIESGVTVVEGTLLSSAGDGTLKVGAAAVAIARSLEAITPTNRQRLRVEVL